MSQSHGTHAVSRATELERKPALVATQSTRTKRPIGLLVAVIAAEFALGIGAVSAMAGSHRSAVHPIAAVVDAAFTQSPVTAIAAVLNPDVTPALPTHANAKAPAAHHKPTAAPARKPARKAVTVAAARTATTTAPTSQTGYGCAAAFAWLSSHSAPGYQFVCPGYAEGHQAMTCRNTAACPGQQVIVIATPCAAAYMNEAHNSWIISGLAQGKIDPFGYC